MEKGIESDRATFTQYFKVRSYEINWHRQITLPSLANYLQEIAGDHTVQTKIAIADLLPKGITWVLMRIKIDIKRYPVHQQTLKVVTYPTGFEKYYVYRDFKIYDENDCLLVEACSTWLIMDLVKRRMVTVPDFISQIEVPQNIEFMAHLKSKIPVVQNPSNFNEFVANWHDLDVNRHVNNVHYLRWMVETMPASYLENHELQSMDIIYRNESYWKDQIISKVEKSNDHQFIHQLYCKNRNIILSEAESNWKSNL